MNYCFARTLNAGFNDAVRLATEALRNEGFGIISDIDVRETLKKKIGVDFRNYRILGACNPQLAYEALQAEDKIGTMLPCNVVDQALDENRTEVAAIDPLASMQAVDNPHLKEAAKRVRDKLERAVASIRESAGAAVA